MKIDISLKENTILYSSQKKKYKKNVPLNPKQIHFI